MRELMGACVSSKINSKKALRIYMI